MDLATRKGFMKNALLVLSLVGIIAFFTGCSSTVLVKSSWEQNQIKIDGNDSDWKDRTFYLSDQSAILGVRNDSSFLYLFLKFTDKDKIRQVMRPGFTVWFDPEGGDDKVFGIRYPIGRMAGEPFAMGEDSESKENQSSDKQSEKEDRSFDFNNFADQMATEFEIVHDEDANPERMSIMDAKGIELKTKRSRDEFLYEMKIPLHGNAEHPYAINPKGNQIGVGFAAKNFQRLGGGKPSAGDGDIGDGGGRRGGISGGEGGMSPGESGEGMERGEGRRGRGERGGERSSKSLDLWIKVNIAQKK
jgi:hypothetical protein